MRPISWRTPTNEELTYDFKTDGETYYNGRNGGQRAMTADQFIYWVRGHGQFELITPSQAERFDPHTDESVLGDGYPPSWSRLEAGVARGETIPCIIAERFVLSDGAVRYTCISGRHRAGMALKHGSPIYIIAIPPIPAGTFINGAD